MSAKPLRKPVEGHAVRIRTDLYDRLRVVSRERVLGVNLLVNIAVERLLESLLPADVWLPAEPTYYCQKCNGRVEAVRIDTLDSAEPQYMAGDHVCTVDKAAPHACTVCGTENDACLRLLHTETGRPCCGACHNSDTHGALRPLPTQALPSDPSRA